MRPPAGTLGQPSGVGRERRRHAAVVLRLRRELEARLLYESVRKD